MLEGALAPACEEALARRQVPGAAVGVLAGERVWTAGFGVLHVRGREPVAADSNFRIASVTKPFTATLALQASLAGVIGFDEEVPGPVEGVTVQHLLSHLGGFEGECGDLARFGDGDDALERLVADLQGQRVVVLPGWLWSYCNAGYWLLAHVLAERLGTSYEQALHDRVLHPLRLEHTGFGAPDATGHEHGQPVAGGYPRARNASGGLVSTVGDLLAFARFHLDDATQPRSARRSWRRRAAGTASGSRSSGWATSTCGAMRATTAASGRGSSSRRSAVSPSPR